MAVKSYTNIVSAKLTPEMASPGLGLFTGALHTLGDRPSLSRLTLNRYCMNESSAHVLATITGLSELGLSDPTQTVLNILPEWLGRLSKSLVALNFTVNFKLLIVTASSLTYFRRAVIMSLQAS
jgi:hypothetical protein